MRPDAAGGDATPTGNGQARPRGRAPASADPAELERVLRVFHEPGDVVEIRALNVRRGGRVVQAMNGYFRRFDLAAAEAARLSGTAEGVYFALNQVHPDLYARRSDRIDVAGKGETTSDNEIVRRRWLLVDTDAVRLTNISATELEVQAAIALRDRIASELARRGWPDPVRAHSGNGGHLLYRIDLEREDGGVVQRALEALAAEFSTDRVKVDRSVHNPARITKLYGTRACKGDSTLERPHRMSRLEW